MTNTYTYYTAKCMYPAIGRYVQYVTIGLTKQAIETRNPNAETIEYSTVEFDLERPVIQVPTSSKFTDYTNEFVFIGEPVNSKGSPTGIRYITIPELEPLARKWWDKQREIQRARMNSYYSQPWV